MTSLLAHAGPTLLWGAASLLMALLHGALVVPRLAEPPDGPQLAKLPYRALRAPRRILALALMTAVTQPALAAVAAPLRPVWFVYGAAVAALVWVDACTTWLPRPLTVLVGGELAAAASIAIWLTPDRSSLAVSLGAGAVGAALFWWLFWRLSRGGIGFGDVLLAPLIGAVAATMGMSGWFAAWLSGAALGVVWGGLVARRHPAPGTTNGFAYGPALWAGPYCALLWTGLSGQP